MSGALIEVTVKDEGIRKLFARLASRMTSMKPVMAEIGEIVIESVQRNFEEQQSPDGKKWPALKASTLKRKGKSGKILIRTSTLLKSIHRSETNDSVKVGTGMVYGATHQFGAKKGAFGSAILTRQLGSAGRSGATLFARARKVPIPWGDIPARPFLGVRDTDWPEIKDALNAWLTKGGTGATA